MLVYPGQSAEPNVHTAGEQGPRQKARFRCAVVAMVFGDGSYSLASRRIAVDSTLGWACSRSTSMEACFCDFLSCSRRTGFSPIRGFVATPIPSLAMGAEPCKSRIARRLWRTIREATGSAGKSRGSYPEPSAGRHRPGVAVPGSGFGMRLAAWQTCRLRRPMRWMIECCRSSGCSKCRCSGR